MNRNVALTLLYTFTSALTLSVWTSSVLSSYLKTLKGTFGYVGAAEACQGIFQLIAAVPAGWLADKLRRDKILAVGGYSGILAFGFLLFALLFGMRRNNDLEFWLVTGALSLIGVMQGLVNGPIQAIYADSVSKDDRPRLQTYSFALGVIGRAAGPLTSYILFLKLRIDVFALSEQRRIMIIGAAASIAPLIFLFFFDDAKSLGRESESITISSPSAQSSGAEPLLSPSADPEDCLRPGVEGSGHSTSSAGWCGLCRKKSARVPLLLLCSDVISGLASGMTIKFFPLFFQDDRCVNLKPSSVAVMWAGTRVGIGLWSLVARRISDRIGRIATVLVHKVIGISLLFYMYFVSIGYDEKAGNTPPIWKNVSIIAPVYIVRTIVMNCNGGLRKSILNDYVPKSNRAKWNSLDSVTRFGWSGSAFIGGAICDAYGYGPSFAVTASMQLAACCVTATLLRYVRDK